MQDGHRKYVILSPHCDDAFLSLGGWILQNSSQVKIVDLFATCAWTTSPDTFEINDLTQINLKEERLAANRARVALSIHDNPEALLRGYKHWQTRDVLEKDASLIRDLQRTVKKEIKNANKIMFPMAVGFHIDHLMVRNILNVIIDDVYECNTEVYLYEDLPYAWYGGVQTEIDYLSKTYKLTSEVIDITEYLKEKLALLKLYKTQLSSTDIRKVVEYSHNISEGRYSERVWRVERG